MISAALVFASVFTASSAQTADSFSQVNVNLPNITVELKGTDFDTENLSGVKASLGDSALTVKEFHPYNQNDDSTLVYMMVDISATISKDEKYGGMVKNYIKEYASNMSSKDAMVLLTFGEKVTRILDATNDAEKIGKAVDNLEFNEDYTHLYDALDNVYNEVSSSVTDYTRTYAMVFTDCDDDTKTGVTEEEIKKYSTHQLPLYVAAPDFAEKKSTDALGAIARASGGNLEKTDTKESFRSFGDNIDKVSILTLEADNNNATGEEKNLQISFDNYSFNINVAVSRSVADNDLPSIKSLDYDEQNNRFIIKFSEKVTDASQKGAYSVVDESGKKWTIAEAEAQTASDIVQLVMSEQITNGLYTVAAEGLTDVSNQKNPLTENTKSVEVTGITPPVEEGMGILPLLIAVAGALVIIAGVTVMIIVLSRRNANKGEIGEIPIAAVVPHQVSSDVINEYSSCAPRVKHHIINENTVKLQMRIKTGKSSEQLINTEVADSVIIGRSSICEIFIDDAKLSRQHFAIENIDSELYISDLNSKNGTFVNGVRVTGRRKLVNHDRIVAGLSEISVTITE